MFVVTCYFKHLKDIFEVAEINVTKENKREIDKIIHDIVGIKYKDCSATWREVKKRLLEDKENFISELGRLWIKTQ